MTCLCIHIYTYYALLTYYGSHYIVYYIIHVHMHSHTLHVWHYSLCSFLSWCLFLCVERPSGWVPGTAGEGAATVAGNGDGASQGVWETGGHWRHQGLHPLQRKPHSTQQILCRGMWVIMCIYSMRILHKREEKEKKGTQTCLQISAVKGYKHSITCIYMYMLHV